MTNEHYIVSTDSIDRDRYTSSQTRERSLNAAIIQANISEGFEEYLEIYDEFMLTMSRQAAKRGKN